MILGMSAPMILGTSTPVILGTSAPMILGTRTYEWTFDLNIFHLNEWGAKYAEGGQIR